MYSDIRLVFDISILVANNNYTETNRIEGIICNILMDNDYMLYKIKYTMTPNCVVELLICSVTKGEQRQSSVTLHSTHRHYL